MAILIQTDQINVFSRESPLQNCQFVVGEGSQQQERESSFCPEPCREITEIFFYQLNVSEFKKPDLRFLTGTLDVVLL